MVLSAELKSKMDKNITIFQRVHSRNEYGGFVQRKKKLIKFAERVSIENISRLLVELRFAALKLKGT